MERKIKIQKFNREKTKKDFKAIARAENDLAYLELLATDDVSTLNLETSLVDELPYQDDSYIKGLFDQIA